MKLLMRDEAKGREHTIFVTIFSALMVMLAIVVMLMASATAISGVTLQLDENAVDILDKQVENRAGYIQDQLQQAQELTDLSTYINETAQQMLDDETLSLKTLDSSSSDSLPLLLAAAPYPGQRHSLRRSGRRASGKLHGHQTPVERAAERPSRQLSTGLHHLRPEGRGAGSSCHLQHR